jgi:hypothetical protein
MTDLEFAIERLTTKVINRLAAVYGDEWERRNATVPENDVLVLWRHELTPFLSALYRVNWALENLPIRCPNVREFRALCFNAPSRATELLPAPAPNPERANAAHQAQATTPVRTGGYNYRAWIGRLHAREAAGERLNPNQIRCLENVGQRYPAAPE